MRRVHQNIVVNGRDWGDRSVRKHSKFCNEGKWNNFINPLLPADCTDMTLVEIGCNAGLFLRMAKEKGFANVLGIESDLNAYNMALKYRDSLKMDYTVLH